jgi:cytidylate kinase
MAEDNSSVSAASHSPDPNDNLEIDSGRAGLVVAIDGPSGAGKGTVARAVASRLGYRHIDTGAMYRAIAWLALHDGVDLADEDAVASLAARASLTVGDGTVVVDGHDVASAIRTPEIDAAAAAVARQVRVRGVLIAQQRETGRAGRVVMEGRDIGTVVFPDAEVKVFLDASPDERARRRASDPAHAAGRTGAAVQDVATALEARDRSDRTRTASPLTRADDAVEIDTTGLPVEEVIAQVLALVARRRRA